MEFRDTTPAAETIWINVQGTISGPQRLLLAFEMSLFARELAKAGILRQNPHWGEAEIDRELLRRAFLPSALPERLR